MTRMGFDDYCAAFTTLALRRQDGILEVRLHTDGGPLLWSRRTHSELAEAFRAISHDDRNEVVILTGTGDVFSGPSVAPGEARRAMGYQSSAEWQAVAAEGRRLQFHLLDIDVPVIGAINGPALRHPELPLMSDIVLAAEHATIQDAAHFQGGLVPGDGVHVVFPALMGLTRARYFLFTGQVLTAGEAKEMGLVNEVVTADRLLPRAWELARQLLQQSRTVRRLTRTLMTNDLKDRMNRHLPYGLSLEGFAILEGNPAPPCDQQL